MSSQFPDLSSQLLREEDRRGRARVGGELEPRRHPSAPPPQHGKVGRAGNPGSLRTGSFDYALSKLRRLDIRKRWIGSKLEFHFALVGRRPMTTQGRLPGQAPSQKAARGGEPQEWVGQPPGKNAQ